MGAVPAQSRRWFRPLGCAGRWVARSRVSQQVCTGLQPEHCLGTAVTSNQRSEGGGGLVGLFIIILCLYLLFPWLSAPPQQLHSTAGPTASGTSSPGFSKRGSGHGGVQVGVQL